MKIQRERQAAERNIPLTQITPEGYLARFSGVVDGVPLYTRSNNRLAAASISADELWPASQAPWGSGATGLDLSGTGITVALVENDGGVRTSHTAFGGRVIQRDGAPLDTGGHATEVAGTLGAYLSSNGAITGVAYDANIEAFDNANLQAERAGQASGAPAQGGKILTLSNNSWSAVQGWSIINLGSVNRWYFGGSAETAGNRDEDQKYGRYLTDGPIDYDPVEIDQFVSGSGSHHLLIYSSGNDTGKGPQSAAMPITQTVFNPVTGQYQTTTSNTGVYYALADNG